MYLRLSRAGGVLTDGQVGGAAAAASAPTTESLAAIVLLGMEKKGAKAGGSMEVDTSAAASGASSNKRPAASAPAAVATASGASSNKRPAPSSSAAATAGGSPQRAPDAAQGNLAAVRLVAETLGLYRSSTEDTSPHDIQECAEAIVNAVDEARSPDTGGLLRLVVYALRFNVSSHTFNPSGTLTCATPQAHRVAVFAGGSR